MENNVKLTEEQVKAAEKRSNFIKTVNSGDCEVIEVGNFFGDCYIIGERKEEAAKWLKDHTTTKLLGSSAVENIVKKIRKCEQMFGVTIGTLY